MQKKGQIGLFLILGFVILLSAGFIFYLNSTSRNNKLNEINELSLAYPVKNYVEICIKNTANDALFFIGSRGGYYDMPEVSIELIPERMPYYYINGHKLNPSKATIEKEISKYFSRHLDECIGDLKALRQQGYSFDGGIKNSHTLITDEQISIKLDYPLKIYKDNFNAKFDEFAYVVPTKLGIIIKIISEMINQIPQSKSICLNCLLNYSLIYNLTIKIYEISNSTFIISIEDNSSIIDKEFLKFRFAVQLPKEYNYNASLRLQISSQSAEAGYLFTYKLPEQNKKVKYKTYTNLFEIDEYTGIINFTPTLEQIGTHLIPMDIIDEEGNIEKGFLTLNVSFFNKPPIIKYLGYRTAYINKPFYYQVSVFDEDDKNHYYLDNSNLFNISLQTGVINFTPTVKDLGSHKINITVIDPKGGKDIKELYLVVTSG